MLALDTATDAVSVALHDGHTVVAEQAVDGRRRHAEVLAPLIADLLAEAKLVAADVTSVAVGCGPGAFTGLRVGLATATTFAHARAIPAYGVGTLEVVAHEALTWGSVGAGERFAVALDARRREVFWAIFEGAERLTAPAAGVPAELVAHDLRDLVVVGDVESAFPGVFPGAISVNPTARAVAGLVQQEVRAGLARPPKALYVRSPDATMPGPRKRVTPDVAR